MVNYLCVSDRPYKTRTEVFGFYIPITCIYTVSNVSAVITVGIRAGLFVADVSLN